MDKPQSVRVPELGKASGLVPKSVQVSMLGKDKLQGRMFFLVLGSGTVLG